MLEEDARPLAVRLEPDNYWYQYYLGHALDVDRRPSEALGAYRTALALKPGSLVVNSSQGGGTKDSFVLMDGGNVQQQTMGGMSQNQGSKA